jgi:hypothetical protein
MDHANPPHAPPASPGATLARAPGWTAGGAIALTTSVVRRAAWPLLGATLLAQLPLLLLDWLNGSDDGLYRLAGGFIGVVQSGLVAAGVAASLRGERPRLGAMFSTVGSRFLPLTLQAFLGGLAVALGLVLLVVPGLVAWAGFMVSTPAVLAEPGLKANEALQRSWDLTRGRRLPVFLAGAVYLLAYLAGVSALAGLDVLLELSPGPSGLLLELAPLPFLVAFAACPAVLYHLLREEREGADPARLGAVFE